MNGTELFEKYNDQLVLDKSTAYNRCIPAFDCLYDLINENKDMFANFCDFPNPLRDTMKYLDVYRYTLYYASKAQYRNKELYANMTMYYRFCKANYMILGRAVPSSDGDVTNIRKVLKNTTPEIYMQMIDNLLDKNR